MTQIFIYACAFCCAFLCMQIAMGAGRQAKTRISFANDRLRRIDKGDPLEDVLKKIRENRGLDSEGNFKNAVRKLETLVVHSGLPLGDYGIYVIMAALAVVIGLLGLVIKGSLVFGAAGAMLGFIFPLLALHFLVKRRRKKAVMQLPNALDIIVRSLAAGHPIPVAMSLVGREMPDPIGSEFGIASDEISFGADLGTAVQRIADRVGHEDLELFAAMIRLQQRTGGNLAELLRASAGTIRDRQKMRLKIRAASAEGRMSALILNAAPIGLFLVITLIAPDFYGDLSENALVSKGLWGVVIWMCIGNVIIRRMINFRI